MLCREVLRLKGTVPRTQDGWGVMPDMFFYRDPDEIDKEQEEARLAKEAAAGGADAPGTTDWDVGGGTGVVAAAADGGLDWAAEPTGTGDWATDPTGAANWGDPQQQATSWE